MDANYSEISVQEMIDALAAREDDAATRAEREKIRDCRRRLLLVLAEADNLLA